MLQVCTDFKPFQVTLALEVFLIPSGITLLPSVTFGTQNAQGLH